MGRGKGQDTGSGRGAMALIFVFSLVADQDPRWVDGRTVCFSRGQAVRKEICEQISPLISMRHTRESKHIHT